MVNSKLKETTKFSVKAACKHLGIGPHTLRAWEVRYGAVEPRRSSSGQRQYTSAEITRLEMIVQLVNLGHSVGTVASLSNSELSRLMRRAPETSAPNSEMKTFISDLESSLRSFDINRVSSLLNQKRLSLGTRAFVLDVLSVVLAWMGARVARSDMSVAHEHALSAIVRDQIYQSLRYGTIPLTSTNTARVVLATPEDDLHEFGILMAATLLAHHGISGHLLGSNLPAEPLALAAKAIKADIIILGNSPVPEAERKVGFGTYLEILHKQLPKSTEVWIGGAGKLPHLRAVMPGRETRFLSSLKEFDEFIARLGK